MIIDKDKLDWVQVDLTARCQAMCLECARNIEGVTVNPYIGKSNTWDMPLEIFQKAVTPSMFKSNLKKILLNGNFGDPCIHPNFLNIADYVVQSVLNSHDRNNFNFTVATNGAMFDNEYWAKVGKTLSPLSGHKVQFALDGLEDTHSIYRRNTKYEDIIEHVKSFTEHGGKAVWQFIIFEHNVHQVDEARKRASDLGMEFRLVGDPNMNSGGARSYQNTVDNLRTEHKETDSNVRVGQQTKKQKEVVVSKVKNESIKKAESHIQTEAVKKVNESTNTHKNLNPSVKDINDLLDTAKISCQYYENKGMYIEYDGTVWMCCWTGDMHKRKERAFGGAKFDTDQWDHIQNKFGDNFNSLHHHTFDEILNHEFFVSYLDKTFNNTRYHPDTPRIHTCAKTCIWNKNFSK
tara:strand:- start:1013 stop:2227 length:1215 start_codon:yes stop_codon:yes gene_type:complete